MISQRGIALIAALSGLLMMAGWLVLILSLIRQNRF